MAKRSSYVLAVDDAIPHFCADCEGPIPEGGGAGVWLYRMSITDRGRFRVEGLCPECGLQKSPVLTAALAASWEKFAALANAQAATTEGSTHAH